MDAALSVRVLHEEIHISVEDGQVLVSDEGRLRVPDAEVEILRVQPLVKLFAFQSEVHEVVEGELLDVGGRTPRSAIPVSHARMVHAGLLGAEVPPIHEVIVQAMLRAVPLVPQALGKVAQIRPFGHGLLHLRDVVDHERFLCVSVREALVQLRLVVESAKRPEMLRRNARVIRRPVAGDVENRIVPRIVPRGDIGAVDRFERDRLPGAADFAPVKKGPLWSGTPHKLGLGHPPALRRDGALRRQACLSDDGARVVLRVRHVLGGPLQQSFEGGLEYRLRRLLHSRVGGVLFPLGVILPFHRRGPRFGVRLGSGEHPTLRAVAKLDSEVAGYYVIYKQSRQGAVV
mmetsp:Transcript_15255/g.57987  ORF Transcript_15255/g.57987 Transcript_15255/m.57987 type:complete len:345 (-) Transcript_15255:1045-2079(-)